MGHHTLDVYGGVGGALWWLPSGCSLLRFLEACAGVGFCVGASPVQTARSRVGLVDVHSEQRNPRESRGRASYLARTLARGPGYGEASVR